MLGAACALNLTAARAAAQQTPAPAKAESLKVRVALSRDADLRLFSVRVRRLVAIELYGVVKVDERANGSLDADLIRVWIDVPTPERGLIEVRRSGRSLARRALDLTNLPSDVAARIVAIETAEMVRVQARAATRPKNKTPATSEDGDSQRIPYAVEGGAAVRWLPLQQAALLAGPELSVEHRHGVFGQRLYARWLIGDAGVLGPMRWVEAGAGADARLRIDEKLSVRLGASAGLAAVTLPHARLVNGDTVATDWSAALDLLAGVELRAGEALLGAGATGGVLLRDIEALPRDGSVGQLGIMSLGLRLTVAAAPPEPPAADRDQ